jgi:hypothetical protein
MVDSPTTREPSEEEFRQMANVLARFQNEFVVWVDMFPNLWELLAFVHYEGIDLPIVREAEPFIKG